jgi:hypothetical protein
MGWRDSLRATRDIRVLRSHYLPFPGAFEPRVGPDQTTLCLLAILNLGDRAFRTIRDRDGVAEKSHLYLARILELYANVIEMGHGIYGVEAASQYLLRRQRAWSYPGTVGHAGGRPAESKRLGSQESEPDATMASATYFAT